MIKALLFTLMVLLLWGCCKSDLPETGLTGTWQITNIRLVCASPYDEIVRLREQNNGNGRVVFRSDSTGGFTPSIPYFTDTNTEFTWSYNVDDVVPIQGRQFINLIFPETISMQSFYYQIADDTLDFFFSSLHPTGGVGCMHYYRLDLIREK